jgi:hypothetical protein
MRALARTGMLGGLALGLGVALALPVAGAARAADPPPSGTPWTATWTTGPTASAASGLSHSGLSDQTIRNVVYPTIGGPAVRVRLSNRSATGRSPSTR